MDYSYEYAAESGIGFMIFYLIYMLLIFGLNIAAYVLRSLGVYTIADRRGIKCPWMAWVPVVDYYLLGCISDQYQYVVKGKVKNKRKMLLGLNIGLAVTCTAFFVFFGVAFGEIFESTFYGYGMTEAEMMEDVLGPMIGMVVTMIPMMILSITVLVFRYMAMYDLYTSCSPQNNVLFLVLSIVFNVTEPFFIFFNRKKDDGMPPRKPEPQNYAPPQIVDDVPQTAPETDPWDRPDSE